MEKIAIFPGSFDPFTIGHESIVRRAMPLFDKIIIALGYNKDKQGYFPLEKRIQWIQQVFKNEDKIEVQKYDGLTVDFCLKNKASYILRGLRTAVDFDYERVIAQTNKAMAPNIESVFIMTTPEMTSVHSNVIREIFEHGGDTTSFVPKEIQLSR